MIYQQGNLAKYKSSNPLKKLMLKYFFHQIEKVFQNFQPKVSKVIDAGCGEGFISEYLYNQCHISELYGVDLSKDAISYAQKNQNKNIHFSVGNIMHLNYSNNDFDAVCSFEVLEHIRSPELVLQELCRISKKYIILSVPNEPFFCLGNFISGKNLTRFGNPIDHINHYTYWGFEKFLRKNIPFIKYNLKIYNCFVWTLAVVEKLD